MKSTKLLMADHELILEALQVLDAMSTEIRNGRDVNSDDVRSLLTFLAEFADGCHHLKEEVIFFPALVQAGMEFQVRVMTYEHERGRALIDAMRDTMDRNNKNDFIRYSGRYVDLLSEHIEKENSVLFGRADQILSDDEDQKIADAFEHYETVTLGAETHERLRLTIEALASNYLAATVR